MVVLGFDDGGYFERSWVWATLALACVCGLSLLLREGVEIGRLELATLGLLGAVAAWELLSATWGIAGTESVPEAKRTLLYVTGFAAVAVVVARSSLRALLGGTLAGIGVVSVYGLGYRLLGPDRLDPYEGRTLFEPIGYANAHGILATMGIVLALGFAAFGARGWIRLGAAALGAVLLWALVLTESRGSWIALAVAVVVLVVRAAPRHRVRRLLPPLLAAVVLVAVAVAVVRPSLSLGNRREYWRVALLDARGHPLLGSGAGTFDDVWLVERRIPDGARDAHSLYLESLAELGPLGLLLVAAALAVPLAGATRRPDEPLVAAAAAAYVAFLVHAGLDWDWEIPAVTLTALVCAAALLAARRGAGQNRATASRCRS